MLFKPLAYASTLDRPEPSYVEALWSPSLGTSLEIVHAKADAIIPALIQAATRGGVFLSQAGPRFVLCLLQAGHHPWLCETVSETTRATRSGRPRCESYAARELAHAPPGEGSAVTGLARILDGAIQALRRRQREDRVGKR